MEEYSTEEDEEKEEQSSARDSVSSPYQYQWEEGNEGEIDPEK